MFGTNQYMVLQQGNRYLTQHQILRIIKILISSKAQPMNQRQNMIENNKDECLPYSSCSIQEQAPTRKVKFTWNDNAPKNTKGVSDRYLPIRRQPTSAKQLYIDRPQWQQQEASANRNQKKGLTLMQMFEHEVLGKDIQQSKEDEIQSFASSNFLKFNEERDDQNKIQFNSRGLISIQEKNLPIKKQKQRKINKVPTKVLDAPALYDDFYLNLVDWSANNLLAVGLSNCVYIWNASNSKVVRLVQLSQNDLVTSNSSSPTTNVLGVGTHSGEVQLWDCCKFKKIITLRGHAGRVGTLAWNSDHVMASGSRDKNILVRDIRTSNEYVSKLVGHKQQVCGIKWSYDQQQLCSGGNDNKLLIWNSTIPEPIIKFCDHTAAVKAMAWSPHQHGLLVSGGGTADRTIKFRNTFTGLTTKSIDVGSQVCNLMFSKTVNEIVSTHGYSLNEINIWKCPKMQKVATLTGHTYRVLYLAMSPDGTTIVTGAGDETLRFWNVFPKKEKEVEGKSELTFNSMCLR